MCDGAFKHWALMFLANRFFLSWVGRKEALKIRNECQKRDN